LSNHKFGSNKINLKFAKTRSEQVRPKLSPEEIEANRKARAPQRDAPENEDADKRHKNPNMIPIVGGVVPELKKPKGPRIKTENKKSRLIIRNLSFKVTEEKIKEYFGSCGVIKDINILKKPDGRLVGCAFLQFETVPQAAKAVRELNHKPFLG
jgi:RNA recognition motif-containing protein